MSHKLLVVRGLWVVVMMCGSTSEGFELASPVLLVDGYNMCGYWPKLKKHFSRGHLDTAREKLVHELITFSHIKGNRNSILSKIILLFFIHIPSGASTNIVLAYLHL